MKFFDVFTLALFAAFAAARPQDPIEGGSPDLTDDDALHGWCQCVIRGKTPAVPIGDITSKACLKWEAQSGITTTYDPIEVRCFTITSRIPGSAFQRACSAEGAFDAKCS